MNEKNMDERKPDNNAPINQADKTGKSPSAGSMKSLADRSHPRWRKFAGACLFLFGILLPLGTVIFEFITGMCAEMFFDPIPSIGHAAVVLLVPLANFLLWLALQNKLRTNTRSVALGLGIVNGAAIAIALYYTILFLPILPMAAMALVMVIIGIGILGLFPLAPLFSLISAMIYRLKIKKALFTDRPFPGLWRGILLGIFLLTAVSAPEVVTRVGLRMAASSDNATSIRGIRWLRSLGNEEVMLRACYQIRSRPVDLASWLLFMNSPLSTDRSRDIYFRVTGESFNTKPASAVRSGRAALWSGADEFDFDPEQGGEVVAGRLKGLSLADSRIDGSIDPDAALGYLEWTMVFRNDHVWQREARAQILLPPGAVVSRLTLWIDGEEREAAFGGRSQVKQAYRKVVRRRRDPVVVTTTGPNRILVQCFPVPPNGGEMKTRIGITAPIIVEQADNATLLLPRFTERNFRIKANTSHGVWIESQGRLTANHLPLRADKTRERPFALRGQLTDQELNNYSGNIRVSRDPSRLTAWAADNTDPINASDNAADAQYVVWQKLEARTPSPVGRAVVVVDASSGMDGYLDQIAASLEKAPAGLEMAVLVASDELIEVSGVKKGRDNHGAAAEKLRSLKCVGGQDNTDALLRAWDLAAQSDRGTILWIHGPQNYLLSAGEQLRQALQRRPDHPVLYEIQTGQGPHRLIEKLDGLNPVKRIVRRGELERDLGRVFDQWSGKGQQWQAPRKRVLVANLTSDPLLANVEKSSRHLVRLWAHDAVMDDITSGDITRIKAARERGIRYHLVTPLSGAVVLENQQQYDEAGLQPVAPGSVPTIPEPEHWAMIFMALAMAVYALYRQRQLLYRT